jgi:hypothetical protein
VNFLCKKWPWYLVDLVAALAPVQAAVLVQLASQNQFASQNHQFANQHHLVVQAPALAAALQIDDLARN